jgi:uncharacterized protein YlxW (UPF0749 family)
MKLNAMPHPNGNTPKHFEDAGITLSNALINVKDALATLQFDIVHSRNYQHLHGDEAWNTRKRDMKALAEVRQAQAKLYELKDALLEIAARAREEA